MRSKLRRIVPLALVVACPALVLAQQADGEIEQIIVTGSRIARPDFESASPIISITADAFARTSSTSVDTVVSRLPQFTPDFTSTSNNPGNGGQGNVQLRGLGATSTLVLLDGRRVVPANGNGVVDVNVIPASLVESVEIVSGGASAVYGSDAIAGVVNFKLKKEVRRPAVRRQLGPVRPGRRLRLFGRPHRRDVVCRRPRRDLWLRRLHRTRGCICSRQRDFSAVALGYVGPGAGTLGPDNGFLPQGSQDHR